MEHSWVLFSARDGQMYIADDIFPSATKLVNTNTVKTVVITPTFYGIKLTMQ